jgi:hypothetical protein
VVKLVDVGNDFVPVVGLLLGVCQLLQFPVQVVEFGGQFLPTELQFTESDCFSLIGIKEALTLAEALAALLHLGLLSGERSQIVLFALRPALMQRRNDPRGTEELTERVPYESIQAISPH